MVSKLTGFQDSEPGIWLWWVRRRDLGRSLFAAVFPEFIACEQPGQRGRGRQGKSAGLVRPAANGEDSARRALTTRHCGLRSREKAMHLGKDDQRSMGQGIRRTQRRAASATACCKYAWLEISKARGAKTAPCAGRSGAACSAVLWGAKPARRGGRQPTPGGKRSAQPVLDVKDATKKGAMLPRATTARVRQNSGCRHPRRSGDPALARPPAPVPTSVPA